MKKISFETFTQLANGRRNFAGLDLTGHDLSGLDLTGSTFDRADLRDVSLFEAQLAGSTFAGANLGFAKLGKVNATGATFSGSEAFPILGVDGNFARSVFRGLGEVKAARYDRANFAQARFENIDFVGCNFNGCNFRSAVFVNVTVTRCSFEGADFSAADLSGFAFPFERDSPLLQAKTASARNYQPYTLTNFLDARDRLKKASKGPELDRSKGIPSDLAATLEDLRKMSGMTQKEFASRVALPVRTYQDWQAHPDRFGKLAFRQFAHLAEKLNFKP